MSWLNPKPPLKISRSPGNPFKVPASGWWRALRRTFWNALDSDVTMRCAGVAFYSFIAIFPSVAICVLLLGLLAEPQVIGYWVALLDDLVPQQVIDIVNNRLTGLLGQTSRDLGIGLAISVGFALWSGSRGIDALLYALTRVNEVYELRGMISGFVFSIMMTIAAIVVSMMVLLGVAGIPALASAFPGTYPIETLFLWGRWPVLALLVFAVITIVYRVGPYRRDASWRRVLPGAAMATLIWLIVSLLFSLYVENFASYDAMFGSLAAAVILMLWLYYSSYTVVIGAMFNAELEYETRRALVESGD